MNRAKRLFGASMVAMACSSAWCAEAAEIVISDSASPKVDLSTGRVVTRVATTIPETATVAAATDGKTLSQGGHLQNHGIDLLSPDGTAAGALDISQGGSLVVDADVTDLSFDTAEGCVSGEYADGVTEETFLPRNPSKATESLAITYWKGRTLADIRSLRALVDYNNGGTLGKVAVQACYFKNDGTTATAVFQFHANLVHQMTARVELKQTGDDITAQVKWISAYLYASDEGDPSTSIDQGIYDASETGASGIGIRALEAGELGSIAGKGVVVNPGYETVSTSALTTTPVLYWKGLKLSDIDGVCGVLERVDTAWAPGTVESRSDTEMTVSFQGYRAANAGHIMAARVKLTQREDGIYAAKVASGYCTWHEDATCAIPCPEKKISYDGNTGVSSLLPVLKRTVEINGRISLGGRFDLNGATVKVGSPVVDETFLPAGTGVVNFVRNSTSRYRQGIRYESSGVSGDCSGLMIFDDAYVSLTQGRPFQCKLFVLTNGATVVEKEGVNRFGAGASFYIYPGSELQIPSGNPARGETLYIYGGAVKYEGVHWCGGIIHFANGGRFYGSTLKTDGTWFSKPMIVSDGDGSTTNEIATAISFEGNSSFVLFACRGDDLLVSGALSKFNASGRFRKGGPKKLILAGTTASAAGCAEIDGGPLRLATATALTGVNTVKLGSTASLEIAAGVAATLGGLDVANASQAETSGQELVLEEGASLALPADSLTFANEAVLKVGGAPGERAFRVGTSACLTAQQLRSIRWTVNGKDRGSVQDADGYVSPKGSGLLILFR